MIRQNVPLSCPSGVEINIKKKKSVLPHVSCIEKAFWCDVTMWVAMRPVQFNAFWNFQNVLCSNIGFENDRIWAFLNYILTNLQVQVPGAGTWYLRHHENLACGGISEKGIQNAVQSANVGSQVKPMIPNKGNFAPCILPWKIGVKNWGKELYLSKIPNF